MPRSVFVILMTLILAIAGTITFATYSYWEYHERLRSDGFVKIYQPGEMGTFGRDTIVRIADGKRLNPTMLNKQE